MISRNKSAAVVLSALMAFTAVSCGTKNNESTDAPAATEAAVQETTAAETSTETTETSAETTAAPEEETEETEKSKVFVPLGGSKDEEDAETSAASGEMGDAETTNGKYIPDSSFAFVDGLKNGMTVAEAKAVLGEPEAESNEMGITTLMYGENFFIFGDFTDTLTSLVTIDDEEDEDDDEDDEDEAQESENETAEPVLMMMSLSDDSITGYGGLKVGSTKDEVTDAFCRDLEDNTPDELKEDNTTLLYGLDAIKALEELEGDDNVDIDELGSGDVNIPEGKLYRLGMITDDDDDNMVAYCEFSSDKIYMLMFELDDEEKVSTIMTMLIDTSSFSESIGDE